MFEPLRFVAASEVKEELEAGGEGSDFHALSEEVRAAEVSEILFVHDQKKIYGTEFLVCTTQVVWGRVV